MGQVYRARDERLSREVALKVVHADLAQDAERLRRFEHEAKAAGTLNHPNIVAVYDTGQHDGSPYIVSELLEGETLRDRMATGALGARKAVEYGDPDRARPRGRAREGHRPPRPEAREPVPDEGRARQDPRLRDREARAAGRGDGRDRRRDAVPHRTSPGTMLGTVGYMSPEQVRGLAADHRSDLFSFGAVLFEMLTGKRAFKGTTAADTLSAILREDPTEALGHRARASGRPAPCRAAVPREGPEDRFQSARDLAFALEGATHRVAVPRRPAPARPPRRRRLDGARAAAAALARRGRRSASGWVARLAPPPAPPTFQRLTFRVGRVESARFAPDGETIVYSAGWGTSPSELFSTRASATGSRPLGLQDAAILAISSREEMAILLRPRAVTCSAFEGTLARAPLAGGTPREVLEGVLDADWSPDGKELAVVHVVGERYRLEYPIGRVLVRARAPDLDQPTVGVSPDGDRVAFVEHPVAGDARGGISVVGLNEPRRSLASGFAAVDGPELVAERETRSGSAPAGSGERPSRSMP